jgi:hypothetical protein
MAWTWRCVDASGETVTDVDLPGGSFPSQADAESWIGEEWPQLLSAGVDAVFLLDEAVEVYGPMSLRPPA